jgi:hypothetical protein
MKKLLMTVALMSVSGIASANLVTNGSFEDPIVTAGTWVGPLASIPGWTAVSGPGIEVRNNVVGTAFDGDNFVEMDSDANSAMNSDAIATTSGGSYLLSYSYSPRIGESPATNPIDIFWNGLQLNEITGLGGSINNWVTLYFNVTGTGSDVIGFAANGISDSLGGNVDDVQLNAVPLPAAALLFGSALLGAGALGRKRNEKETEVVAA